METCRSCSCVGGCELWEGFSELWASSCKGGCELREGLSKNSWASSWVEGCGANEGFSAESWASSWGGGCRPGEDFSESWAFSWAGSCGLGDGLSESRASSRAVCCEVGNKRIMEIAISLRRSLRSRDTVPSTPRRAPNWSPVLRLMPHHAPLVVPCRRSMYEPRARSSQVNPGRTLQVYRAVCFARRASL
jgi:hypothetical protein